MARPRKKRKYTRRATTANGRGREAILKHLEAALANVDTKKAELRRAMSGVTEWMRKLNLHTRGHRITRRRA